jgi:hypothetical protein
VRARASSLPHHGKRITSLGPPVGGCIPTHSCAAWRTRGTRFAGKLVLHGMRVAFEGHHPTADETYPRADPDDAVNLRRFRAGATDGSSSAASAPDRAIPGDTRAERPT